MNNPKRIGELSIPAIATAYRQFEFRSRLEAKWAVFFDLCGWSWSYEPIDLNGWIPDFAIGERPVLVEIKPFFKFAEWVEAKKKIIDSGCRENVILLGADPVWLSVEAPTDEPGCVWSETPTAAPIVGWLFSPHDGEYDQTFHLHFGMAGNGKIGLCPMDGPWRNQIWKIPNTSGTDKAAQVHLSWDQKEKWFVERWAKACNVSKWIPANERNQRS